MFLELLKNNLILSISLVVSFTIRILFSIDNVKTLFYDIESYNLSAKEFLSLNILDVKAYHPPAYPAFIALIYKIFGESYLYVYIIQSILGTIITLLIYLIARNIFSQRVARISVIASLFYLPLSLYSGILMSEIVFIFFLLLGIYLFIKLLNPTFD